jgi:cell division protein FtsI (penicillin-binding protein 3)
MNMHTPSHESPKEPFHKRKKLFRLTALMLGLVISFAFILSKFYHLQITHGPKWMEKARKQHYFSVQEPFMRGVFYSNGSIGTNHPDTTAPFVLDVERFHLHADPKSINQALKSDISSRLAKILAITKTRQERLYKQLNSQSRNRRLASWLTKEQRNAIVEWWIPYAKKNRLPRNVLFFTTDYRRSYPFGRLLGQLLHTIREQKDEKTLQAVPTGGLEMHFNTYLQGKVGKRRLMRSPRHAYELGEEITIPTNGADVYLTINHHIQAIAEEELAKAALRSRAKRAWAVMMHPDSGDIWAIAQYPFFDPADYKRYFNDKNLIEDTRLKALSDAIEPGSVFKPFTLCTALLANETLTRRGEPALFSPDEKIDTRSGRFPGRSKPLKDVQNYSYLNLNMATQKSSNIYMARLMERVVARLGKAWYRAVLAEIFGFGKRTGIEYPSETPGLLPSIGKKHPNGALEWSLSTPASLAMGYNIQVNSIQLLKAYALLANGGMLVQPTFLRKITNSNNDGTTKILVDNTKRSRKRILSPHIIAPVVNAMKYTTKQGGTAPKGDVYGYTEAGKSGTVHKLQPDGQYGNTHRTLFIGFTPVSKPAFVLLVAIDEPEVHFLPNGTTTHRGGASAAPVFRAIATRTLEYLGIPPDDPHGYHPDDPRFDPSKADWIAETKSLLQKHKEWNSPPSSL